MASSNAAGTAASRHLFVGLDSSTQGLKATAIDAQLNVVHTSAVNYQRDLPHYKTTNGVHAKPGNVVTQPTIMVRARTGAGSR
jgi:xylulokinase